MQLDEQLEKLVAAYGHYRYQTVYAFSMRQQGRKFPATVSATSKNGKEVRVALSAMVGWCEERGVDPTVWLYWLFSRGYGWKIAPKAKQLCSEKSFKRFCMNHGNTRPQHGLQRQHLIEQHKFQKDSGEVHDPNRDITSSAEALKARYVAAGEYERCMSQMATLTFGFHPRSRVCIVCPVARQCEQSLRAATPGFDIIAIRLATSSGRHPSGGNPSNAS